MADPILVAIAEHRHATEEAAVFERELDALGLYHGPLRLNLELMDRRTDRMLRRLVRIKPTTLEGVAALSRHLLTYLGAGEHDFGVVGLALETFSRAAD